MLHVASPQNSFFMKLRYILSVAAIATTSIANAQLPAWIHDTVSMAVQPSGTTFANDVYYHLGTGTSKIESNSNWHLAFSMGPIEGAYAIHANHATSAGVSVYNLNKQATGNFGNNLVADTVGKKSTPLYNSITTYETGAFNQNANPSSMFDFGWGKYDGSGPTATHYIKGDSIYLVTTPNGHYQVWIEEFKTTQPTSWKFHTRPIDGSGTTTTQTIATANYTNKLFAYYDIASNTVLDREPGNNTWDFAFTRYMDDVMPGMKYAYTGILSNHNIGIAKLHKIDGDTAQYRNYPLDSTINMIGRNWKSNGAPMGTTYALDTFTYFILSTDTNIYAMEVIHATTGAGGAKIGIRKRIVQAKPVAPNSVNDVNGVGNELNVFPNPASSNVTMLLNMKAAAKANIAIVDLTGKVIMQTQQQLTNGLNALQADVSSYPAGTYVLMIQAGDWKVARKVAIQR
jgi:hypothetical protein